MTPHTVRSARAAAVVAVLLVALRVVLGRSRRVVVTGESMRPTLLPGDQLLVWRPVRGVRAGDVVAHRDRFDGRLRVKRVAAGPGGAVVVDGRMVEAGEGLVLLGDNRVLSTDSRSEGAVAPELVLGVAVARIAPRGRRAVLRYDRGP